MRLARSIRGAVRAKVADKCNYCIIKLGRYGHAGNLAPPRKPRGTQENQSKTLVTPENLAPRRKPGHAGKPRRVENPWAPGKPARLENPSPRRKTSLRLENSWHAGKRNRASKTPWDAGKTPGHAGKPRSASKTAGKPRFRVENHLARGENLAPRRKPWYSCRIRPPATVSGHGFPGLGFSRYVV